MTRPRVGVVGDLGPEAVAPWLAVRVLRAELGRRLPGVEVVVLAPLPVAGPLDGGQPPEALGIWSAARRAELAARLDCLVLLGGGDRGPVPLRDQGLGPEHDQDCPSLRLDAGELAVLARRALPDQAVARRLAWLRLMGWQPSWGRAVLVDAEAVAGSGVGPATLARALQSVGRAHPNLFPVVVGPRPEPMVDALEAAFPGRVMGLAGPLSLEDVAAAYGAAAAVVGAPGPSEGLALAYGRPFMDAGALVRPEPAAGPGPSAGASPAPGGAQALEEAALGPRAPEEPGWGRVAGEPGRGKAAEEPGRGERRRAQMEASADDRLAQLAELAQTSVAQRRGEAAGPLDDRPGPLAQWAQAHRARGRQVAVLRVAWADQFRDALERQAEVEVHLGRLRAEASAGYARFEAELADLRAQLADRRGQVEAVTAERDDLSMRLAEETEERARLEWELRATHETRLFRWSSVPRGVYGQLRRNLR